MPTPYRKEFRRDVVAVARRGEQSRAQIARSFGISESCLARWLAIADREEGLSGSQPRAGGPDDTAVSLADEPNLPAYSPRTA
jgi:transposase